MDTKRIHCMLEDMAEYGKEMISCATGSGNVNLHDAMQIVDMVKDLADAEYHALIAREMRKEHEEEEEEEKYILRMLKEEHGMSEEDSRRFYDAWRYKSGRFAPKGRGTRRGYEEPPYYHMTPEMYRENDPEYWRDLDRSKGRLYFSEPMPNLGMRQDMGKTERMRDSREGRAGEMRRGYMEAKEIHTDNTPESKQAKMRELEKYMRSLSDDLTEAIDGASNEEKSMLKTKLQTLVQKIQ